MDLGTAVAFWGVSLLFVITPGADWAYAIAAGLRHRSVLPSVAGLLSGHVLATVVVAAGVAGLIARSPTLLTALTVAGALYLAYLGAATFARPPAPQAATAPGLWSTSTAPTVVAWQRQLVTGAGISCLNPKVFLLFLALLPQFTDPSSTWPVAGQILVLGGVHVLSCAVVYTLVGTGARRLLSARPGAARLVSRLSGAAMVLIAAVLLLEQLLH